MLEARPQSRPPDKDVVPTTVTKKWRLKDTQRGPLVWDVKHVPLMPKDDRGLPGAALHLIVARSALEPGDVKDFVSNASADTPLEELLVVAFSRWHVERCFEDQKPSWASTISRDVRTLDSSVTRR
jgi:hypothetical protein